MWNGPATTFPANLVAICDEICGEVAVRSYSALLSIFSFGADKTLLPPSFGQFSRMVIIAAAAYYVFNMYGLCLVMFMPAFCGQTVNPWFVLGHSLMDLCISMVRILSWIQWLQSVSNMKSFLINYHHNCHFRPKTRNYVQTEISEPLVYRLYVWCAITFYLACLTCVNRWFLNQVTYLEWNHILFGMFECKLTLSDPGL